MTDVILTQTESQRAAGLAWLMGEGDSMSGDFNPGDPLLVDTNVKSYVGEGMYVFQIDNHRFIKRLQRSPEGIAVMSSNPVYKTWFMTPDMDVKFIGRVIKAYKGKTV